MPDSTISSRIYLNTKRPPAELLREFHDTPTGNVCDAMDRLGAMDYRIKPLDPGMHLVGPALTVRTWPGDNLLVWKALDVAQAGDVLVVATCNFTTCSTFGDRLVMAAKSLGLAGIVCDGMCRDRQGMLDTQLPIFTFGLVPSSPQKYGPGEIGSTVSCGGVVVRSGDIVLGDADGVVVVPLVDANTVVENLQAIRQKELAMIEAMHNGQFVPSWVDAALAEQGCRIIDLQHEIAPYSMEGSAR